MAESTSNRGRRPRRSTRSSQRLERARQRNADQLAAQRQREQRVEDALHDFIEAGEIIATEDASCEEKLAALHRKIDALRVESQERVTGEHTRQAQAALAIHEAGRTVEQVADLLELRSEKEARRMIAAGRTASEAGGGPAQDRDTVQAEPTGQPTVAAAGEETTGAASGEQRQPRGVDGPQHRPDSGFVQSVASDGCRQSA